MGFMRAEVVARVPSRNRFAELAAGWLTETREKLFPEFDRGLRAGPSTPGQREDDQDALMGPPGGAAATIWVRRKPSELGGSQAAYSDPAWQRTLTRLADSYPFHTDLSGVMLDEQGMLGDPYHTVTVGVQRLHRHPEWVILNTHVAVGTAGDPVGMASLADHEQRAWAEHIKTWAIRADACYAHVTDDPSIMGGTALEDATVRDIEETVPRCREVLRGYSWVTVCATELAARLGGADALRGSGAFDEVAELPGGQVFLRATPVVQDHEGPALRRVFEVLAPVLLPGRPRPETNALEYCRLVADADAGDYQ